MNVIDDLVHEHRQAESLLAALAASERGASRYTSLGELEDVLLGHMTFEEGFFYALVSQVLDTEIAEQARAEHELVRGALVTVRQCADRPGFDAALEMLKAGIDHHIQAEESTIFPQLRRHASDMLTDVQRRPAQQLG